MPRFYAVYVTKLGVPFIEGAQEYESERDAANDAASTFIPTRDEKGNYHHSPVMVKTLEGRYIVLTDIDHIRIMTPEELAEAQEQERRAQAEMAASYDDSHGPGDYA